MKWFKKKETEKREAPEKDIPRNRDEFSTNLPQLQAAQVQAKLSELYKAPDLKQALRLKAKNGLIYSLCYVYLTC